MSAGPMKDGGGEGRDAEFESEAIVAAVRRVFAPHLWRAGGRRFWESWRRTLRLLRPLGAVSLGNQIRVHSEGDELFERLWLSLRAARQHVILDTYILEPDSLGERTLSELEAAAERGVRVEVVLDAFGSGDIPEERIAKLRASGARVVLYNPFRFFAFGQKLSRLIRNHRKITVVDGELAFCGGMNISIDYGGKRFGNSLFRDTHLELRGPCARDLAQLSGQHFEPKASRTLRQRIRQRRNKRRRSSLSIPQEQEGSLVQVLESNIARQRRAIQRALRLTIKRSQEKCYLTSPYFVPPKSLMRHLIRAARRGVDVRILTAGRSDVPTVRAASQHLYGRLLRNGVRIFELRERTLHAKTATIDGVYATVGSFNLDSWSYRRNLEVTVGVLSSQMALEIEQQFKEDLEGSEEVCLETWNRRNLWQRAKHWAAYQLMRI